MRRAPLLVLLAFVAAAHAIDTAELADPGQQQRYEVLIHQLKCLQCQGENIADTPAQFAVDIRRQVREMIMAGKSNAEVRKYMVDRYGEIILLRPRWSLANAWLYLLPALLLALGVFVAARILRTRRELLVTDASEVDEVEQHS